MFGPQKSPRHVGGNYAQAGARDMRCKARGVTPSRNVSGWTEVIAKLGRTVAAGIKIGEGNANCKMQSAEWEEAYSSQRTADSQSKIKSGMANAEH